MREKHVVYNGYSTADVWEQARTFGCGNPRTTGSTGGDKVIVSRRNVSRFVTIGTAKRKGRKVTKQVTE